MCTDVLRDPSFPDRFRTRAQMLLKIMPHFPNLSCQEWSEDTEVPRIGRCAAVATAARKERPSGQQHFAPAAALGLNSV